MTDKRSQNSDPFSNEDELLTPALRTPALNQDALERVSVAVEREWRAAKGWLQRFIKGENRAKSL